MEHQYLEVKWSQQAEEREARREAKREAQEAALDAEVNAGVEALEQVGVAAAAHPTPTCAPPLKGRKAKSHPRLVPQAERDSKTLVTFLARRKQYHKAKRGKARDRFFLNHPWVVERQEPALQAAGRGGGGGGGGRVDGADLIGVGGGGSGSEGGGGPRVREVPRRGLPAVIGGGTGRLADLSGIPEDIAWGRRRRLLVSFCPPTVAVCQEAR